MRILKPESLPGRSTQSVHCGEIVMKIRGILLRFV